MTLVVFIFGEMLFNTFVFLPAFGQANILQDEPTGIIDTCKSYLQTVAFVQSMMIGAAIFSSASWGQLEKLAKKNTHTHTHMFFVVP